MNSASVQRCVRSGIVCVWQRIRFTLWTLWHSMCVWLWTYVHKSSSSSKVWRQIRFVLCAVSILLRVWRCKGRKEFYDNKVATVLGSIPASSDTVESEGRRIKQCRITHIKRINSNQFPFILLVKFVMCMHIYLTFFCSIRIVTFQ
jgi:hypothetical protein